MGQNKTLIWKQYNSTYHNWNCGTDWKLTLGSEIHISTLKPDSTWEKKSKSAIKRFQNLHQNGQTETTPTG